MRLPVLSCFVLIAALTGCDNTIFSNGGVKLGGGDGGGDGGSPDGGTTADGGTVTEQGWCGVQQVVASECVLCHSATGLAGNLDLQTDPHGALVSQPSSLYAGRTLVVPKSSDDSFMITKMSASQGAKEGDPMPPQGALDDATVQLVRDWIDAGASSDCDEPTDTGTVVDYHPKGYDDPTVHGMEAKLHEQTCTDCHGADLTGDTLAPSCDSCHTKGWRENCTYCHGGVENETGAPPEQIDDGTEDLVYGAHSRHVTENTHSAFDCTQCHVKPTDVLSAGHLFDATPATAETDLSSGLSSSGYWDGGAMGCANMYCHGNGQGHNGTVLVADAPLLCSSCHPSKRSGADTWEDMSGEHKKHMEEGLGCEACHEATTTDGDTINDPALHVNGTVDILLEHDTITWSGTSCDGSCHREDHDNRDWHED